MRRHARSWLCWTRRDERAAFVGAHAMAIGERAKPGPDAQDASPLPADWALSGTFGPERWHHDGQRFASVAAAGERIELPADPLTLERLRTRTPHCAHPGPFPLAFRFCPACGTALAEAPALPSAESWSPPFGAPDGLPSLDEPRRPDPASREEIPVPASAALGFAVAGTPPMLLACDRIGGWISGWSEAAGAWIERVQIPPCPGLPRQGWAAGASASGLALPTDRGAAFLDLTGARRSPTTILDAGPAAGGVATLRAHAALPVRTAAGLAVAVLDHAAPATGWTLLPVPDAPAGSAGPFAAPVVTADTAIWCDASGRIALQAAAGGLVASWSRWRDAVRPLPGVRPVMERNGTLHQLARLDERTLVLEALAAPGQEPERRAARGYTPGTGRAVFRENARLRLPWDDRAAADYILPDDSFLLPLLAFDEDRYLLAVCTDRSGLGRFLGDPAAAAQAERPHLCTLVYSPGPRSLEPLDCVLRAHHAWDLSVFIHADWLHVHGAVENRCHRWRLRDAR